MKARFNLLISVVGAVGYRLARLNLDTSKLTEQDKDIILEHYLLGEVHKHLANLPGWEEGEFLTLDAKQFVPIPYEEKEPELQLDGTSLAEIQAKLKERGEKKRFLNSLKPSMRDKVTNLLKTYSLEEVKEVFQELKSRKPE